MYQGQHLTSQDDFQLKDRTDMVFLQTRKEKSRFSKMQVLILTITQARQSDGSMSSTPQPLRVASRWARARLAPSTVLWTALRKLPVLQVGSWDQVNKPALSAAPGLGVWGPDPGKAPPAPSPSGVLPVAFPGLPHVTPLPAGCVEVHPVWTPCLSRSPPG